MNLFQRLRDALTPQSPPPPGGVIKMQQALDDLGPSTKSLREKIERPVPSMADVFIRLNQPDRESQ